MGGLLPEDYEAYFDHCQVRGRRARGLIRQHAEREGHLRAVAEFESNFAAANFGNIRRWDIATPNQVALIRELWLDVTDGEGTDEVLDKWIARFGVSSLRFLTRDRAGKVIAALKSWKARLVAKVDREAP